MTKQEIYNSLFSALINIGIDISNLMNTNDINTDFDIDLREYITDSILFISFVVELENRLSISIPDNLLRIEVLASSNGLVNMLDTIISEGKIENE